MSLLNETRSALERRLGPAAVSAAAIIIANFSKNDRLANGLGIPAEEKFPGPTRELLDALGITNYRSALNTFKPD